MRKDLLASLLAVSAATPLGAYANVSLNGFIDNGNDWTVSGLPGDSDLKSINLVDGVFTSKAASFGTMSIAVKELNKGDYKFTANEVTNATVILSGDNIVFKVQALDKDGKPVVDDEGEPVYEVKSEVEFSAAGDYDFSLTGASVITISVKSTDGVSGFEFGKIGFQIVFENFSELQAAYQDALDAIEPVAVNAADKSTNATSLNKEFTALTKEKTALQADVDKLKDETLEVYNELGLYNEPTDVESDIEDLAGKVETYNKNAKDENTRFDNETLYTSLVADLTTAKKTYAGYVAADQKTIDAITDKDAKAEVQGHFDASKATIDGEITALESTLASIKDAYTVGTTDVEDLNGTEVLSNFQSDFDKLTSDIESLKDLNIDDNLKAWDVIYAETTGLLDQLLKAYNTCYSYYMGLTGYTFSTVQMEALNAIYDKAKSEIEGTLFFEAADKADVNKKTCDEAIAEMEAQQAADQKKVESYTTAQKAISKKVDDAQASLDATIEAVEKAGVQNDEPYKTEIANIQKAIDDANKAIANADKSYDESALPTEKIVNGINDQIDGLLDDPYVSNVKSIALWNDMLESAEKAIKKACTQYDMPSKFVDAYTGIKNAIDKLDAQNEEQHNDPKTEVEKFASTDADYITVGIEAYETDGVKAATILQGAYTAYSDMSKSYSSLNTYFNNNKDYNISDDTKVATWQEDITAYNTALTNRLTKINKIYADNSGEKIYDACVELGNEKIVVEVVDKTGKVERTVTDNLTLNVLDNARKQLANNLVNNNMKTVNALFDTWAAELNDANAEAVYGPALKELKAQLEAINVDAADKVDGTYREQANKLQDKVDAANKAANKATTTVKYVNAYDGLAADIQDLYNKMQSFQDDLDAAKANVVNNGTLADLIEKAQKAINDQETWLGTNILSPAKEYYLKNDLATCQKDLDSIKAAIEKAYKANGLDKDATSQFNDQIGTLSKNVANIATTATNNQMAYNAQMDLAQQANAAIAEILNAITDGTLNASVIVNLEIDGTIYETIGDIQDLLENKYKEDIVAQNKIVYSTFGEGQSKAKDQEISAVYNKIIENVASIKLGITDDYNGDIINTNNATFNDVWKPVLDKLNAAFTNGVETYSKYNTASTNTGYLAALQEAMEGHDYSIIYKYSLMISDLNKQAEKIKTDNSPVKDATVITADAFKDVIDTAEGYIKEMNDYADGVVEAANDCADAYYKDQYGEAKTNVTDITNDLKTDGVVAEIITEVMEANEGHLEKAETLYTDYAKEDKQSLYIDLVLNEIAAVVTDKATIYGDTWTKSITFVNDSLGNVKTMIETLKGKGINVEDQLTAIAEASDSWNALQAYVEKNCKNNLVDNMSGIYNNGFWHWNEDSYDYELIPSINDILTIITNANNQALAAEKKYAAESEQLAAFQEDLVDLWKEYNAMASAVGTLDLTLEQFQNDVQVQVAYQKVQDIEDALDGCTDAATKKAKYEAMFANAQTQINDCYAEAYLCEKANLNKILNDLKRAFNDKRAEAEDPNSEQLNNWNKQINDIAVEVANLPTVSEKVGYAEVFEQLNKLEKDLETLYKEIGGSVDQENKAKVEAETALTTQYDEIQKAIADAQAEFYNSSVKDYEDLGESLQEISNELEAVKEKVDNAGNMIALLSASYSEEMDAVQEELKNWINDYQKAEAKQTLNNTNYDRLNAQIENLQKLIDTTKDLIENTYANLYDYQKTDYLNIIEENVQEWLNQDKERIDELNDKVALTNGSNLSSSNSVEKYLLWVIKKASSDEVYNIYDAAENKYYSTSNTINSKTYADSETLKDEINELLDQLDDLYYGRDDLQKESNNLNVDLIWGGTAEEMKDLNDAIKTYLENVNGYIANANDLITACDALLAQAKEMEVILGDLTDDKTITVADYNALIQMILDGDEYDPKDKASVAADVNGDKTINVADITGLINAMLGNNVQYAPQSRLPRVNDNEYASVQSMGKVDGAHCYALNLNNEGQYVSAQFDIVLEDGVEITDVTIGERAAALEIYTSLNNDGTMRVVIASPELSTIQGNDGAVVYINAVGGNFSIENMIVSDARGRAYAIGTSHAGTSFIDGIMTDMHKAKETIYNVGGQLLNRVQRGINIIRNSDGTTDKVYKK